MPDSRWSPLLLLLLAGHVRFLCFAGLRGGLGLLLLELFLTCQFFLLAALHRVLPRIAVWIGFG